jgi:hypothetical protein
VWLAQAAACEVVLGISGHDSHAIPTSADDAGSAVDGSMGDPDADAAAPRCAFATTGDARLRVGVMLATFDRFDVCVAGAGQAFGGKPILAATTGDACPDGLAYKDVSAPIPLAAGAYDVKIVPRGADCSAAAIATASNVTVVSQRTVAVYLVGNGVDAPKLVPFAESRAGAARIRLRLIHALASEPALGRPANVAPPLDMQLLNTGSSPPAVVTTYASGVAFGQTAPVAPDAGNPIDENGYFEIATPDLHATFGVAPTGAGALLAVKEALLHGSDTSTAFAIGRDGDPSFPRELYVCDEGRSDGVLARCGAAAPALLRVATHNPYEWGVFAPFVAARKGPAIDALSKLDADVVCVSELWSDADKMALIAKAKSAFPYSYMTTDTLATQPNDATDQSGVVPPAPTTPPCAASATKLNAALDCVAKYCAVTPGDDSTAVAADSPVACITGNCLSEAEALFAGSPQDRACWSCAYTSINDGSPIHDGKTRCVTEPLARFSYKGANSAVVLSRYPIDMMKSEEWVLPSTEWRTTFLRAVVQPSPGAEIAVYCGEITSPQDPVFHPYAGQYGGGASGAAAWRNEQLLQAQKLVDYVTRRSIGQQAIVAGEFYAGPAITNVVAGLNAPAFAALAGAFAVAEAPDFPGACTFCNDNPITTPPGSTPTVDSTWTSLIWSFGLARVDVSRSSIFLNDATINVPSAGYAIPPSPYYGFRTVVRVRF